MIDAIEFLDPVSRVLVATVSVNGGRPEIETPNPVLRAEFLDSLPDILAGGNKVLGLIGDNGACYYKELSPGDPGYWHSICQIVGDYLMRDPKTGEVF